MLKDGSEVLKKVNSSQQSSLNNEADAENEVSKDEGVCKYNLAEMLPHIPEDLVSKEDVAKMKAIEKKMSKV